MTQVVYKIVKHDEGWAYKVGETFSGTFSSIDNTRAAARLAAGEHQLMGRTVGIVYEDTAGKWHEELSGGTDRPFTRVEG